LRDSRDSRSRGERKGASLSAKGNKRLESVHFGSPSIQKESRQKTSHRFALDVKRKKKKPKPGDLVSSKGGCMPRKQTWTNNIRNGALENEGGGWGGGGGCGGGGGGGVTTNLQPRGSFRFEGRAHPSPTLNLKKGQEVKWGKEILIEVSRLKAVISASKKKGQGQLKLDYPAKPEKKLNSSIRAHVAPKGKLNASLEKDSYLTSPSENREKKHSWKKNRPFETWPKKR